MPSVILETMAHIVTVITPFLPVAGAGITTLSLAGLVPRVGPGRAASVALRSLFRPNILFRKSVESVRSTELQSLRKVLKKPNWGQNYVVITGGKGFGKSFLLASATEHTAGIVHVKTQPTHDADTVIHMALSNLTNLRFNLYNPAANAKRVIFWHRIFTLGRTPTIVIAMAERKIGVPSPSLTGAVRSLVDDYGLRVIVDSSPNSVDDTLLQTKRADVIDVAPMTKEMIWSLPQLGELISVLDETGLAEVAWFVLGGIPASYEKMWFVYQRRWTEGKDKTELVGEFLCYEVYDATKIVRDSHSANPMMERIIHFFDPHLGFIPSKLLQSEKLTRSTPDKVFSEVEVSGETVLIPASNAIDIVLRYSMTKKPTVEELVRIADDLALNKCLEQTSDGVAASHGLPTNQVGDINKQRMPCLKVHEKC